MREDVAGGDAKLTEDEGETASKILDVAERLVQLRGFNGFSYADVAAELGISKASLHYHFAGKAELGRGADRTLRGAIPGSLDEIDTRPDRRPRQARRVREALRRRASAQAHVPVRDARGRVPDAPEADASAVVSFFDDQEAWLVRVLEQGREEGTLRFSGPASEAAQMIVGGLDARGDCRLSPRGRTTVAARPSSTTAHLTRRGSRPELIRSVGRMWFREELSGW